ncbi:MAG TPA: DUF2934 domain-containing protein [Vicinamibacterales bacterium]|nr:DUF2934 domain-containing protein [Vicinamibacterales bacterium]
MAKSRKTTDSITTAADRTPKAMAQPATVTDGDIACRAYELYVGRGCEHGHDVEDWLRAERELRRSTAA